MCRTEYASVGHRLPIDAPRHPSWSMPESAVALVCLSVVLSPTCRFHLPHGRVHVACLRLCCFLPAICAPRFAGRILRSIVLTSSSSGWSGSGGTEYSDAFMLHFRSLRIDRCTETQYVPDSTGQYRRTAPAVCNLCMDQLGEQRAVQRWYARRLLQQLPTEQPAADRATLHARAIVRACDSIHSVESLPQGMRCGKVTR